MTPRDALLNGCVLRPSLSDGRTGDEAQGAGTLLLLMPLSVRSHFSVSVNEYLCFQVKLLISTQAHLCRISGSDRLGMNSLSRSAPKQKAPGHGSVSQITPPGSNKSRTPVSQAGFRGRSPPADSATAQKPLVLCAVEVLASTHGSKLPDPRNDAVLGIILAAVEDGGGADPVVRAMLWDEEAAVAQDSGAEVPGHCGRPRMTAGWGTGKIDVFPDEARLFEGFVDAIQGLDPDVLVSWDITKGGLGFLAERAAAAGLMALLQRVSRAPELRNPKENWGRVEEPKPGSLGAGAEGETGPFQTPGGGQQHIPGFPAGGEEMASGSMSSQGLQIVGRVPINLWEIIRSEVKLNIYTFENCVHAILQRRVPKASCSSLLYLQCLSMDPICYLSSLSCFHGKTRSALPLLPSTTQSIQVPTHSSLHESIASPHIFLRAGATLSARRLEPGPGQVASSEIPGEPGLTHTKDDGAAGPCVPHRRAGTHIWH